MSIPSHMLLDPIIQRSAYAVLQGASGAGKTRLIMQLVSALQQPCPDFFGLSGQPDLKIALITGDQPVRVYEANAHEAGVDLTQINWHAHQAPDPHDDRRRFGGTERFDYFLYTLDQLYRDHGIDLFIIEPIGTWLAVDLLNYNKSTARLAELNYWLGQRTCGMLVTHHHGKAREGQKMMRAQDRIYACSTLHGHACGVLAMDLATEIQKNPTSQTSVRLTVIQRLGPEQVIWIDRDKLSGNWILSNSQRGLKSGPSARQQTLLTYIQGKGGPIFRRALKADWMPSAGIGEKSLDRDLDALVGFGLLKRTVDGYLASSDSASPADPGLALLPS